MNTERICPSCSRPLGAGAPQGLCPECLMKAGFGTGVAPEPGEPTHQPPFTPPTLAELAKLFPQLEILELLGRGGMGAVYKARQPAIDRWVALKVLPPQATARPGFTERFNREARALARLNHPNIVALYEFGQMGGMPYFVMEYVEGVTLRGLVQAHRLEPREALKIVPQICEALQFAHDEGVVHRDIKPENILLDKKGRVKIADFGIAKIMGGDGGEGSPLPADATRAEGGVQGVARPTTALTQDQVLGTPNYMAPEQVEHPQAVDHRADIYSLGVVFYEMLTGELPLGKFQPPSSRMRGLQVDVRLDEVVLHALEKEPELRYQQASQVKTAVETLAQTPPPAPAPWPYVGASKLNPWQPAILIVAALAGVVGLLVGPSLPYPVGLAVSVIAGFGLIIALIKLAGVWPFPSPAFPKSNFTARNLRRAKAPLTTPPPADQAKVEAAQRQVIVPAIALLLLSGLALCVLAVGLPIWIFGAVLSVAGKAALPWLAVIPVLLLMTGGNIVSLIAAWRMRQLRSYNLAVAGSILFILSPWFGIQAGAICGVSSKSWSSMSGVLLGLIFGIWSLLVLSRREVQEAFANTKSQSLAAGEPKSGGVAWKAAVAATIVVVIALGGLLWARNHTARSLELDRPLPAEAVVDLGGGVNMEFVLIHPGSFRMGSDSREEAPARDVTITEPFYLGKYEVTQEQWEAAMGTNPSYFKGPKLPVENVSADDAQDFLRRVREKTGRAFALPTENQWEYACRAGTITRYSFGDSPASLGEYAWFADDSGGVTHPVGEKKPNRWGLYDMHGNVWERCTDGSNFHVIRGGACSLEAKALRASNRAEDSRGDARIGLRCVLAAKSGFAGQTKTPAQELAKDDGASAGMKSVARSGHAVRFEAPNKDCYLTAVRIFGSRYGRPQPPSENGSIWLCDTSFKKIAEFAAPYSYFARGGPGWVTIPVTPTKVPPDFIICVAFNPTATNGVYVHYDSGGSGSSFMGLPGGMGRPFGDGDWLIRAVVRE